MTISSDSPLIECENCGRTWHPVACGRSSRCPSCGSPAVSVATVPPHNRGADGGRALERYVVSSLSRGDSPEQIRDEMVSVYGDANKWAEDYVKTVQRRIVEQLKQSTEGRAAIRRAHARQMLFGLLWLVGGGVITLLTFSAASGGGFSFVFWGAIVWGGISFVRGLFGWMANQG